MMRIVSTQLDFTAAGFDRTFIKAEQSDAKMEKGSELTSGR